MTRVHQELADLDLDLGLQPRRWLRADRISASQREFVANAGQDCSRRAPPNSIAIHCAGYLPIAASRFEEEQMFWIFEGLQARRLARAVRRLNRSAGG